MWQPIETAPKDGTPVDLWMVDHTGRGWREADAYYVTDRQDLVYEWKSNLFVGKTVARDGWWAPNHDYDNEDGWCDKPRTFNNHPTRQVWEFRSPTHWMPLPEPPVTP